ncbi:MAG: aldehyde dehydrogenase family protein [Gammaproteobacteria bacterium]|nr:aldehyde dehydrogenase family protein [Gammaproteobacteria bacterium]
MAARADNLEIRTDFSLLINGELVSSDAWLDVINPATEQVFARCPAADEVQLDAAISAAQSAFAAWSRLTYEERATDVRRYTAVLAEHQDELAELLVREQGKPIAQARAELKSCLKQADNTVGLQIPVELLVDSDTHRIELHYRPLGVVGVITPWNAPAALALGSLSSAVYTGNTVVIKPSPYTPLTTLKMGELAREIFPPGVVNVLTGGDELGRRLCEHPGVQKISFTGSVATGKKVLASSAATLKRVTLELGGNDPAIVLDDADPKAIAKKMFFACFVNSGQVCMAIKRIYAHEDVYDELCEVLAEEARNAPYGDGLDPKNKLGPLQNKMQFDKVVELFEVTKRSGARILVGGNVPNRPGYFLPPTYVTDIADDSRLVTEEQFGPIVPILKFSELEDAIRRANDTRFGLSGSVWTTDSERGKAVAKQLEVGTAWVNQHRAISAYVPFGGAKESGLGRQHSTLGLKSYMEPQVISVTN